MTALFTFISRQKVIGKVVKEIYAIVKKPLVVIKHVVERVVRAIQHTLVKLRDVMVRMKKGIVNIVKVIKRAFAFLAQAANVCNAELGTPFQRCVKLFQVARADCQKKLGFTEILCEITRLVEGLCYSVKFIDYICDFVEYISDASLQEIVDSLARFERDIHDMMYVSVKFNHHFHFDTNASKTFERIRDDLTADVRRQAGMFLVVMTWMHFVSVVFCAWILLK